MSAPPYMKLYVADYHGDTTHLSALEHGAYLLLLMAMWRAGGRLPSDDARLAKLAKVTPEQWAEIRSTILDFFQRRGGRITHKRIAEEMAKYEAVSLKRKAASEKGVSEKRRKNKEKPQPNGSDVVDHLVTKPEPEPEVREEDSVASASPLATAGLLALGIEPADPQASTEAWDRDPDFTKLWDMAPPMMRKRAKSRAKVWPEWKRALRVADAPRILGGFARYKSMDADLPRSGGPGLHIWLKDRTWDEWAGPDGDRTGAWTEAQWSVALRLWREAGEWGEQLGPPPGQPGCRVPPRLIVEAANPNPVRAA
jgi:uncharacterized protein YdaU (DUF1376 family)